MEIRSLPGVPLTRSCHSRTKYSPHSASARLRSSGVNRSSPVRSDAVAASDPRGARGALAPWLANGVLRRYRLPCAACGRGSVGAEAWDESGGDVAAV